MNLKIHTRKQIIWVVVSVILVIVAGLIWWKVAHTEKSTLAMQTFSVFGKAAQLLPIEQDTKEVIAAAQQLSEAVLKKDDVERTYLVLLQNNYELRPGGGFLGQYAVVTILNGEVKELTIEDANLLDQRITAKVTPPYPFNRMMQIKNWKFRDSNFSPDFPTNVEKAEYFYKLSGGWHTFDGVVAVNADVLNGALAITGPVTVPGYSHTFTSDGGALLLEEVVEKAYLGDDVPAEAKEARKNIMKRLGQVMTEKLVTVENIPKLITFGREQLEKKNIMLNFTDKHLQSIVAGVHWDGTVSEDWGGDYLYLVDANMGALKTDYYMKRAIKYEVDLTAEKPTATLTYTYSNTAPYGDWRTSDYHSYLRVYAPQGSNLLEWKMVGYPSIQEEFGKTYFGVKVDVIMGHSTEARFVYELPERFKTDPYSLLIQKQSGAGDIPVDVTVHTSGGDFHQSGTLTKDIKYAFEEVEE